ISLGGGGSGGEPAGYSKEGHAPPPAPAPSSFGTLMLVGVANYEKGTTFETGYDGEGNTLHLNNPLRVGGAWGVGGGIVYKLSLSNNSYIQLYALFGRGATNFSTATDLGTATGFESS